LPVIWSRVGDPFRIGFTSGNPLFYQTRLMNGRWLLRPLLFQAGFNVFQAFRQMTDTGGDFVLRTSFGRGLGGFGRGRKFCKPL